MSVDEKSHFQRHAASHQPCRLMFSWSGLMRAGSMTTADDATRAETRADEGLGEGVSVATTADDATTAETGADEGPGEGVSA